MTGCLFRLQHENALAVIILEVEVHSKGCNPYVVIVARFHQDARGYEPFVPSEAVDGYRTYPADLPALDHFDVAGTSHAPEMLDEFVRLHLEAVNVVLNLDEAGLSYVDDPVFIQRELIVECQQVLVRLGL